MRCEEPRRARFSSRISLSLSSGVAWARKSSTPASAAIAAAVVGLSPVIMMVRMPMRRSSAKRSQMPPLTMSLRWTTPSSFPSRQTASGVPPDLAISSAIAWTSRAASAIHPSSRTERCEPGASAAPIRDLVRVAPSSPRSRIVSRVWLGFLGQRIREDRAHKGGWPPSLMGGESVVSRMDLTVPDYL
jgi:hypothetical protein